MYYVIFINYITNSLLSIFEENIESDKCLTFSFIINKSISCSPNHY